MSTQENGIVTTNSRPKVGNTENSNEVLQDGKIPEGESNDDSEKKSDIPRTSNKESARASEQKNISGKRGYNELQPNRKPKK